MHFANTARLTVIPFCHTPPSSNCNRDIYTIVRSETLVITFPSFSDCCLKIGSRDDTYFFDNVSVI